MEQCGATIYKISLAENEKGLLGEENNDTKKKNNKGVKAQSLLAFLILVQCPPWVLFSLVSLFFPSFRLPLKIHFP